jgi:succinate dehydrogenase / fumarate reductase flavoprotein subunit/L-aspartate oxidase
VTQLALELGAESRDLDALQYHPNGGAWPPNDAGLLDPETTRAYGAALLNADGEEFTDSLGPRDAVSQAIFDEVDAGRGVETPDGRPAVSSTRRASPSRRRDLAAVHAAPLPSAGIDPLRERSSPTRPPLPERRPRDRRARRDDARGLYACGEIAGGTHGRNRMMGNSLLECSSSAAAPAAAAEGGA